MDRDRAELDRGRRYRDWLSNRLALADKEARLQEDFQRLQREAAKVEALHRERRELEENQEEPHLFEELPALLPELRGLRRQAPAMEKQIAELSGHLPAGTGASWAGLAALAGLIAAAGFLILRQRPDLLGPVAGAGGAVFLLFFLNCLKKSRRAGAQRSLIRGQLQVLEENLAAARRRLAELEGRLEGQGLPPGDSGLEALQQRVEQEKRRRQRLREIRSALEVLTDLSALEGQKDALARELAVLRAQQGEPAGPPRAEELAATERKLTLLEQRLAGAEPDLAGALREESFLLGELGDFQGQTEEQEFLQEKEQALVERKEVLALACDLLGDAVRDFRQESLERFTAAAGRALALVTAGRYGRVRMEEGFRFSLEDADGTWRPLDCFSRGTMDAVFFAIRLVLARELFGERRLPLLLDDPMVNFDFQRLTDTLRYLETTAPEYQTLLFSHNRGLLSLIDQPRWQVTDLAAVF
jgi:uncharacterized protein YhaN